MIRLIDGLRMASLAFLLKLGVRRSHSYGVRGLEEKRRDRRAEAGQRLDYWYA